ncbi:MAG: LptF/LptG family permease [Paludibacteraceae bacterium]|nr:LptF/LptG family permease [Paludibacteraceae bacterium]MBR1480627.1 LptF/LptG family permease [Paludibacteraceae bacterium]
MRVGKKIDWYLLRNFVGLLLATFFICIFILLMQFVWLHVRDLVGKGVELSVLAEFFVYAVASLVPMALPLSILLASLVSFSNLGEKSELTAMKAAGISLFRIMRPIALLVLCLSVGAFFFSDRVLPRSQVKLWALIFSLRQKSPELDVPVGEFYDGIHGYNLYVRGKNPKTGMMYGVMIYDYSKGFRDASVTVADSARIYFTEDKKYLLLCVYSGESFENLDQKQQRATRTQRNIPYRRESFSEKQLLIDFDTELNRYDDSVLKDQHVSKNVVELLESIDSVRVIAHEKSREQSMQMVSNSYFGRERRPDRVVLMPEPDEVQAYDIDSLYATLTPEQRMRVATMAAEGARSQRDKIEYNAILLDDSQRYIRKHEIELYRKFTLAFACLIFFFIGAPLGAIIRKGGLGAPVVISVILFVVYYIVDNTGYKMAREALWPCWAGMWLSSFVLLPIGVFLTYKAATDSAIFRPEVWMQTWQNVKLHIQNRYLKIRKK